MSRIPTTPPVTIFKIDLNTIRLFLVDLPPRGTVGMRREQEGWPAVRAEIVARQPAWGQLAGITTTDYNRFIVLDDAFPQIVAALPTVDKALEVLEESLAHVDNLRHRLVTQFADSAEKHARMDGGNPGLLTTYEKAIAYRAVIADKSVKTRQKNEEAKKNGTAPEPAAPGAPPARTPKEREPVSRTPIPPPDTIFAIDLNPLAAFLVDLPPGATRGMRQVQEGWVDVVAEIVAAQKDWGDAAGITDRDFQRFVALNDQYVQIEAQIPTLKKAVEVLGESIAYTDNLRHRLAASFADGAEEHANQDGGDPALLTAYQRTIAYRGVSAEKSIKTRQKNEEAKKAAHGPTGPTPPTSPTGGAPGATGP